MFQDKKYEQRGRCGYSVVDVYYNKIWLVKSNNHWRHALDGKDKTGAKLSYLHIGGTVEEIANFPYFFPLTSVSIYGTIIE